MKLSRWLGLGFCLCAVMPLQGQERSLQDRFRLRGLAELQLAETDSFARPSWLEGDLGRYRYDESDDYHLRLGTLGLDASFEINPASKLHATMLFNQDPNAKAVLTEAYWHLRPVPRSGWRKEYKLGFFYPEFSLENSGPLWTSPYSISPSVINSWFGEELRTLGVEAKWSWRDPRRQLPHEFAITAALFAGNDPAGVILSWRGWINSERQTGLKETLPLIELPNLRPGGLFRRQAQRIEPFLEIDNRPGGYLGFEWRYRRQLKLVAHYYNNQADDTQVEEGQYAWDTRFGQLGLSVNLPGKIELLSQYIYGRTEMHSRSPRPAVDNDFVASYLMLSKAVAVHRISLRWERFEILDRDSTRSDSNNESGHSATLAYAYTYRDHWKFSIQAIRARVDRTARMYYGVGPVQDDRQLLFSLRYYF